MMNKKVSFNIRSSVKCLILLVAFSVSAEGKVLSAVNTNEKGSIISSEQAVETFDVRPSILILVDLASADAKSTIQVIEEINLSKTKMNVAEQYLVLITQAELANQRGAYSKALSYLTLAQEHAKNISTTQLNQPIFFKYHLILANSYEGTNKYQLALEQKSLYLSKYHEFSAVKHEDTILRLTKKYKVLQKNKEIQLLSSENTLKAVQLAEQQRLTQEKQRNVVLTVISLALFILLFFREWMVRRKLFILSKTDVLTHVYNRATFLKQGNTLFVQNNKMKMSVLLLGLDSFKYINDKFGHETGDKILKELAMLGKESMRSTDIFARFDGDQFIALLPDTGIDEAKAIAEHIRDKVASYRFVKHDFTQQVTITIGVASTEQVNINLDDLIHEASLAMAQGKLSGKNKVQDYANMHAN